MLPLSLFPVPVNLFQAIIHTWEFLFVFTKMFSQLMYQRSLNKYMDMDLASPHPHRLVTTGTIYSEFLRAVLHKHEEQELCPFLREKKLKLRVSVNTTLLELEFQFEAINPKCYALNHLTLYHSSEA